MADISHLLLIAGLLLFLSTLASKVSERFGVPALLMFLGVGMLAGSEGIGGIHFDNALLANSIGTAALAYILFSGGLETQWRNIRPVLGRGLLLSTVGVAVTALLLALFVWSVLGFTFTGALLLAAIVSSTDAAAVFSVLRSRGVSLKGNLRPLLELESGSNDPMAVFLTLCHAGWRGETFCVPLPETLRLRLAGSDSLRDSRPARAGGRRRGW